MAALTQVILGIDRLSPTELEAVAELVAAKRGVAPPSSTEAKPQTTGESPPPTVPECQSLTDTPAADTTREVVSTTCGLLDNPDFRSLMTEVSLCSGSPPSGPGRKAWINTRLKALASSWQKLPKGYRDRFTRA